MSKAEAYQIVYDDLVNIGVDLFVGIYDAKNGSRSFMHGIATVMESIAYNASEDTYEKFSKLFYDNMIKSEQKARKE